MSLLQTRVSPQETLTVSTFWWIPRAPHIFMYLIFPNKKGFYYFSPKKSAWVLLRSSSRPAFPRGWELGFIGGEKSKPPSGTKGSQPACVLKPLFGRNGLVSPKGDLQICSEVGNSRGRVLVPDCPLLALQRYS